MAPRGSKLHCPELVNCSVKMDALSPKIKKQATTWAYQSNIGNAFRDYARACSECTRRAGAHVG